MPNPKAPNKLRNTGRLRKLECFEPGCGAIMYASRSAIGRMTAEHGRGPTCGCGAPLYLSDVQDCAEYLPHLVDTHPLVLDDLTRERRAMLDSTGELARENTWGTRHDGRHHCADCGYRRPRGADETEWHCPACGSVNTLAPDGSYSTDRSASAREGAIGLKTDPATAPDRGTIRYPANRTLNIPRAKVPTTTTADEWPF